MDKSVSDNHISIIATPRHSTMQYSTRLSPEDANIRTLPLSNLSPNNAINARIGSLKRNSHLSLNNIQRTAEEYVQHKANSCGAYCPNPLFTIPGTDEEFERLERTRLLRRVRRCSATQIVVGLGLVMNGVLNLAVHTTLYFIGAGFWAGTMAFTSGLLGARCYKDPNTCNKRWNGCFAYVNGILIYWSVFGIAAYALSQDLGNTMFTFLHLLDMVLVFCGDVSAFFQTCVDPPKARQFYERVPGLYKL